MRIKIQKSMGIVLSITLLLSYAVLTGVIYNQTLKEMKANVRQEAFYIKELFLTAGEESFDNIKNISKHNRFTIINKDGTVEYDSERDASKIENQKERIEVVEALKDGTGEYVRFSKTTHKESYYFAILLENGYILRVSKPINSVQFTMEKMLPLMGIIAVVMFLISLILSYWQTQKIIKPINELNLKEPLENNIYPELEPLLRGIDVQNKEKDKVAQMRKEFSANVSHELKTPLTSILGYAEIIQNGIVKKEDISEFAERIHKEANRLIVLIEDIIKLSKLDESKVELEKEEVDLYVLAREVASRLAPQAEKKDIQVSIVGESVIYRGVRQVLDEMFYNICENAIKYNTRGGSVKIWIGNTLKGIKFKVTDTGIGIPKEEEERIFERFYQVDKSHSKQTEGTGLGLSIVKHGAILHKATIKVDSEVEKGTRIEILFQND